MEDRYLYRAKRIDNGEWAIGHLSHPHCTDTEKGVESYYFQERDEHGWYSQCIVEASTICQCTGLKDKNGKLIWENDIVKRKFRLFSSETKYEEKENCGAVKYDESYARFGYQCSVFAMLRESEKYDTLEVIGNIFDNPNCWRW